MLKKSTSKTILNHDVTQIIQGYPAWPVSTLPEIWQNLAVSSAGTGLTDAQRHDYVEAAQLFRYHQTPLGLEALTAIGNDFLISAYPDFNLLLSHTTDDLALKVITATKVLFEEFGYSVPASFYNIILETVTDKHVNTEMRLFKNKKNLAEDRLSDAVLHASLLVTPIGLFVQSILSQHGVIFTHVMNCGCKSAYNPNKPFLISFDQEIRTEYLQNMVAASFEQYGVNAYTSRATRGF